MKKILYIHQYFRTPQEPGGTRSYWFAQELINKGYSVTMVTSTAIQNKLVEVRNVDGIRVIYIRNSYSNDMGIAKRFFSFLRFMIKSTIIVLKEKNIDLTVATSTPLSIGVPALILKWFKNIPFIFEVRDLWPEVPIQMGALKNPIFRYAANWLEKTIYKNAKHIIALSPGMEAGILKQGISPEKVSVIPNMSKIDKFYLREKDSELINKFDLKDEIFYAIHFGTMGIANGLDYILDAAKIIQSKSISKIEILFAGKGGEEKRLKQRCLEENILNVRFLGNYNMAIISEIVNISDVSIVSFKNLPILKTNSPNKLFDSLSAQKPIIVNSSGWTKEMVEDGKCGAYVDPENPNELATLLINWSENKKDVLKMGVNARKLAEDKFDKSILTKKFVDIIDTLLKKGN